MKSTNNSPVISLFLILPPSLSMNINLINCMRHTNTHHII